MHLQAIFSGFNCPLLLYFNPLHLPYTPNRPLFRPLDPIFGSYPGGSQIPNPSNLLILLPHICVCVHHTTPIQFKFHFLHFKFKILNENFEITNKSLRVKIYKFFCGQVRFLYFYNSFRSSDFDPGFTYRVSCVRVRCSLGTFEG